MECPICEAPMTHMGYFRWSCDDCGYSCEGDLPHDQVAAGEDEERA